MFGEWPLFRPVFAMVWMGEMACVLIYRELKYYASTFHNRCLFRDATICLTKLARGKYFSKIDLRLVSPASFMSLSLVILYLPDDIIIGSSRLKLSPMAGDLLGDGGEAFSGACWLYRQCLDVELCVRGSGGYWASMRIESNLMLQIKEAQRDDGELWAIVQNVEDGKHTEFSVDDDSVVWFEDRLCVPNDQALREKVMTEAHSSPFTIHPGSTKMYRDLKQYFWWNGMKQDVATRWRFLWKWDEISMDLLLVVLLSEKDMMRFGWLSELSKCTNEKVAVAKEKLKEARSRQKSYADKHRRDLEFQVGDRVFLKVSPFRGVKRFGIKGKLSPRFIGPFGFWIVLRGFVSSGASSAVIAHSRCLYRISFEGIPVYPLQVAFILLIRSVDMSLSEEPESIRDRKRES
ncbi:retrotransposon protein, putative, ty3-gypsy subclass [Tanacetum coccineum]|uniref:Retrotransposon protein, putative, ty3-gypsy subclass n=1 Tax=Tanacetum coccineum TaxID=301880 RepID=A0ABQ5FV28_9ASTR